MSTIINGKLQLFPCACNKIENMIYSRVLLGIVLLLNISSSAQAIKLAPPTKPPTPPVTVWRKGGAPITGLAVSAERVLITDGSDTAWLYTPDGKLQTPKAGVGFIVCKSALPGRNHPCIHRASPSLGRLIAPRGEFTR